MCRFRRMSFCWNLWTRRHRSNPVMPNGTSCDDGNPLTDFDQCTSGVCRGRDLCQNVVCTAKSNCYGIGSCSHGNCSTPLLPEGTSCDDGNPLTDNDKCSLGVCAGTNYCQNVVCYPSDQCHITTGCSHGICGNATKPSGTACDDGLAYTDNDACGVDGVCRGQDLCQGVTCPSLGQCYTTPVCSHGNCSTTYKALNTPCDDMNPNTDNDQFVTFHDSF